MALCARRRTRRVDRRWSATEPALKMVRQGTGRPGATTAGAEQALSSSAWQQIRGRPLIVAGPVSFGSSGEPEAQLSPNNCQPAGRPGILRGNDRGTILRARISLPSEQRKIERSVSWRGGLSFPRARARLPHQWPAILSARPEWPPRPRRIGPDPPRAR